MNKKIELTAVIEKEDNVYISLCPELDVLWKPARTQSPKTSNAIIDRVLNKINHFSK